MGASHPVHAVGHVRTQLGGPLLLALVAVLRRLPPRLVKEVALFAEARLGVVVHDAEGHRAVLVELRVELVKETARRLAPRRLDVVLVGDFRRRELRVKIEKGGANHLQLLDVFFPGHVFVLS